LTSIRRLLPRSAINRVPGSNAVAGQRGTTPAHRRGPCAVGTGGVFAGTVGLEAYVASGVAVGAACDAVVAVAIAVCVGGDVAVRVGGRSVGGRAGGGVAVCVGGRVGGGVAVCEGGGVTVRVGGAMVGDVVAVPDGVADAVAVARGRSVGSATVGDAVGVIVARGAAAASLGDGAAGDGADTGAPKPC
jgi:hypothetical protein